MYFMHKHFALHFKADKGVCQTYPFVGISLVYLCFPALYCLTVLYGVCVIYCVFCLNFCIPNLMCFLLQKWKKKKKKKKNSDSNGNI